MRFTKTNSIVEYLEKLQSEFSEKIAFSQLVNGQWKFKTFTEFINETYKFARYLKMNKFDKNKKVLLLSESRLEWPAFTFGSILSGATIIPVDIKLTPDEISHIITHSEPDLICYSPNLAELLFNSLEIAKVAIPILEVSQESLDQISDIKTTELPDVSGQDMNILVYTSGTLGAPKGVMTKISAIMSQVNIYHDEFKTQIDERLLSMLPLNHLYEFTGGLCLPLSVGAEICFANSHEKEHLMQCLQQRSVTQMVTVPLFVKSIKDGIERNINSLPKHKKLLVRSLLKLFSKVNSSNLKRKFFKEIHQKFGGHLYRMNVGSAHLSKDLITFFKSIGIELYEGYGLSETGPIVTTNTPNFSKPGSVGKAIKDISIKISDDGEILTKGPHIMSGYYKNMELTKEVLTDDGWFKTGDVGSIDNKGFLHITGRKKKMIVLEGGKKVYPEEVETLFQHHNDIQEAVVLGLNSKNIGSENLNSDTLYAVLVPSADLVENYDGNRDEIQKSLKSISNQIIKKLAPYKRPHHILIFFEELPKTTTQKIKVTKVKESLVLALNEQIPPEQYCFA